MSDLDDGQWRLVYGDIDFTFGTPATPTYNASAPDLGDVEVRQEDADRPREDGRAFGVDFRAGRTITFDFGIFGDDEAEARAAVADLQLAWRGDGVRNEAGKVAELQAQVGTRLRSVFGRPRRLAVNYEPIKDGIALAGADFACVDDLFYGAVESVTYSITPPSDGGLESPLASPLSTTTNSDRSESITVGGELPAWPVVTIDGPITDPVLEVVGLWKLKLATTLAADQSVVIDTQPWARTVLRNGTASLAGALTRDSVRLSRAAIPPGSYEVVLRGTDATGTAKVSISWRTVYTGL